MGVLSHDGLDVAVEAPPGDLEWLEEFLAPSFLVTRDPNARVHVSFDALPPFAGGDSPASTGRVAFALDSGPVRLAERITEDRVDLFGADGALAFQVLDRGRSTRVLRGAHPLPARVRLMRVVREYAHNHSLATGGLILHASAVALGGHAVAIAGAKGAGKTTLALRMLAAPGVEYLSNDRVLVRTGHDAVRAVAVPTVIALRPGTRRLLPELAAELERAGDFRESARERRDRGPAPPDVTGDTWRTSSEQVCFCLGRPRRAAASLACVLFPSRTPVPGNGIRVMHQDEAVGALSEVLVGHHHGYVSELFVPEPGALPGPAIMHERARDLAALVPCVVGHLADDLSSAEAVEWLRECLPHVR